MIHSIICQLYDLVEVRSGDKSEIILGASRDVALNDFLCFQCNSVRFPKGMQRWVYVQVTEIRVLRGESKAVRRSGMVEARFELVLDLSDVTIS